MSTAETTPSVPEVFTVTSSGVNCGVVCKERLQHALQLHYEGMDPNDSNRRLDCPHISYHTDPMSCLVNTEVTAVRVPKG